MPAMNRDDASAWQAIANDVSKQRPSAGRRVRVDSGKHRGIEGTVKIHRVSRYGNAFRYGSDGNLAMREMAGRCGYACLVTADDGVEFWIAADKVTCIDAAAE